MHSTYISFFFLLFALVLINENKTKHENIYYSISQTEKMKEKVIKKWKLSTAAENGKKGVDIHISNGRQISICKKSVEKKD